MKLPEKLKAPEGCAWNEESPHFKINEIIDYLESQKEGELTGAGANWLEEGEEVNPCLHEAAGWPHNSTCFKTKEEPKCSCAIDNVGGNCKWCKEEPKQVNVDVMLFEYATLHAQPNWTHEDYKKMQEIIDTLKQALQQ